MLRFEQPYIEINYFQVFFPDQQVLSQGRMVFPLNNMPGRRYEKWNGNWQTIGSEVSETTVIC